MFWNLGNDSDYTIVKVLISPADSCIRKFVLRALNPFLKLYQVLATGPQNVGIKGRSKYFLVHACQGLKLAGPTGVGIQVRKDGI